MDSTLLPLRELCQEFRHAKFGGNWIANKGETEGGTMCPPAYIITNYPNLNRVNALGKDWEFPSGKPKVPLCSCIYLGRMEG